MAEIDYTIAAKVLPPQFDPLAVAGKALGLQQGQVGIQQGMLNNRLLDQQVQSKIALGRAVTGATNASGQTDWNKAMGALAQDPQGAFAVPELAGTVLDRTLKDLNIDEAELKISGQRWAKIGDTSLALLADQTPLTREGVIKNLTDNLVGSGMFNDAASVGALTNFVQNLPNDDAGIRQRLKNMALMSNTTTERINSLMGTVQNTDVGPNIAVTQTSPVTGATRLNTVIDKGLSPSEADTPAYTYKDAQGVEHIVTKREAAAAGPEQAPGGISSGSPYGTAEAAQADATANVAQAQALQQRVAIVPVRRAALSNLVGTLDSFTPGPKADLTYQLGALATMAGTATPKVVTGVAAQEEFNKLAAQIALDQWGSLGGSGSNEQLQTAMKANPNQAMSRLGIKGVVALLQGNEDAIQSQFDAWQKYSAKFGPGSYGKFLKEWNQYYDPRVFQAQHMEPAAVKAMTSKMSAAELRKFNRDMAIAEQAGWLGVK